MTDDRRYQDDEIRRIFERASSSDAEGARPTPSSGSGLTLAELQDIGREVGLPPGRIAEAAAELEVQRRPSPRRTHLGMPLTVDRSVELPRAPTDREWELLVGELRETFHAPGSVAGHGNLRQWANGNLHAVIEPTETGHRLRLSTLKGDVAPVSAMGLGILAVAFIMMVAAMIKGEADVLAIGTIFGVLGGSVLAGNALRLPRWARERERQMEYIAARAVALIGSEAENDG